MSESQLKKLKSEKDRLEVEAEAVKELVTVSNACQEYVDAIGSFLHAYRSPFLGIWCATIFSTLIL